MTDDRSSPSESSPGPPLPPSHLHPRTRDGWIATIVWLVLFVAAMPPVTHVLLDRPDVWVAGVPLLFAGLLGIYVALIGVLAWAYRRGV